MKSSNAKKTPKPAPKSAPKAQPKAQPKPAAKASRPAPKAKVKKDDLAGAKALDSKTFETDLLGFINTTLVPAGKGSVGAETALFDDGLINSIKILDLIAFVEKSLGVRIPEKLMVMKHFRSPRAITTTFARS